MKNSEELIIPIYKSVECNGLTKREYFAGLAMQGELANSSNAFSAALILETLGIPKDTKYSFEVHYPKYLAIVSVRCADALLAELEKPQP